jgi:hypothetical protein
MSGYDTGNVGGGVSDTVRSDMVQAVAGNIITRIS